MNWKYSGSKNAASFQKIQFTLQLRYIYNLGFLQSPFSDDIERTTEVNVLEVVEESWLGLSWT